MATQLNIPAPCHEKWSGMAHIRPDCRHCAACDRQIVDFTMKRDVEILAYLERNGGKICGRFSASQLGRPLVTKKLEKKGVLTAVAASLVAVLAAQQPDNPARADSLASSLTPTERAHGYPQRPNLDAMQDSLRNISGRVLNEKGDPLPFAEVRFADTHYFANSDADGNYCLIVPMDILRSNPKRLEIAAAGYLKMIVISLPEKLLEEDLALKPISLALPIDLNELDGMSVGFVVVEKRSKVRRFFAKLFR